MPHTAIKTNAVMTSAVRKPLKKIAGARMGNLTQVAALMRVVKRSVATPRRMEMTTMLLKAVVRTTRAGG
jgi:hypothetical protein